MKFPASVGYILTDIEGTTSSISFVHDVLFPYADRHLADFLTIQQDKPEVKEALKQVRQTVNAEPAEDHPEEADRPSLSEKPTLEEYTAVLRYWIARDRKHTGLKALQGMIWKTGFETGAFKGHVYADVAPALERWRAAGLELGVYSSGSVGAQKLYFAHSEAGDLTPYFDHHFDTSVGGKKEATSYRRIARALNRPAKSILFLSDVQAELDAAAEAGLRTCQVLRPGVPPAQDHPQVAGFGEVELNEFS